jgi:hypothetical protein
MGLLLATLEVVRRGVRLEGNRMVDPLIGPQAAYAEHPVFDLAYVSQPLPAYVSGLLAPFAVPMLVYDQRTPSSLGALAASSTMSPTRRSSICWESNLDSERNHCKLCASFRWATITDSVLARAVEVLLRSAAKSEPSR